jgi:hypothetical protein
MSLKPSRGETDDPPVRERTKSSARTAKRSRPISMPEPPLKVLPTGGVLEGNPKGRSGFGIPPGSSFTAVAASAAKATSCPPRSSEVSNRGG